MCRAGRVVVTSLVRRPDTDTRVSVSYRNVCEFNGHVSVKIGRRQPAGPTEFCDPRARLTTTIHDAVNISPLSSRSRLN